MTTVAMTVILIIPIGLNELTVAPTVTIVPVMPIPPTGMTVATKSAAMSPSILTR